MAVGGLRRAGSHPALATVGSLPRLGGLPSPRRSPQPPLPLGVDTGVFYIFFWWWWGGGGLMIARLCITGGVDLVSGAEPSLQPLVLGAGGG